MSNDSGRHYDTATDYGGMALGAVDKTEHALALDQQHPPGTVWAYNNSAIQALEAVLERATGQPVGDFARENLFGPIGMTSRIARDSAGNALTFMGTRASCSDLARFGYLMLRQGVWENEQIVSEEWVDEATSPSQSLNSIYGYLWWLNSHGPRLADQTDGEVVDDGSRWWPHAPDDAFAALGLGGQIVLVIPSEDLVVTRIGPYRWSQQEGPADPDEIARILVG